MDKSTSILRLQVWTERVRECHNSGMTVKDWCGQNNINLKTYYYWQRIVRSQIYAIKVSSGQPPAEAASRFVDITPLAAHPVSGSRDFHPDVILRTGSVTVEISNSASEALLNRISLMLNHA
jgi:putative transposase